MFNFLPALLDFRREKAPQAPVPAPDPTTFASSAAVLPTPAPDPSAPAPAPPAPASPTAPAPALPPAPHGARSRTSSYYRDISSSPGDSIISDRVLRRGFWQELYAL